MRIGDSLRDKLCGDGGVKATIRQGIGRVPVVGGVRQFIVIMMPHTLTRTRTLLVSANMGKSLVCVFIARERPGIRIPVARR